MIPTFSPEKYNFAAKLESLLGVQCTFPLAAQKVPLGEFGEKQTGVKLYNNVAVWPIARRWAYQYWNNPLAINCTKLACIDIDWHDTNNATPYYEYLVKEHPEFLEGLYIERSKNGGYHLVGFQNSYMRNYGKEYNYMVMINGKKHNIEIKIGKERYFLSYPSAGYTPIGKTLVEMLENNELKEISDHWNTNCSQIKKNVKNSYYRPTLCVADSLGDVKADSPEGYEQFLADTWLNCYTGWTGRHYAAGMLAKQLFASGCSAETIKNSVTRFWSFMDREPRKGEIEEALKDASDLSEFEKHSNDFILSKWIKQKV